MPLTTADASSAILSGERFDAADEPYVIKAMRAGDFQEWLNTDGERRFLNVGPEQVDDNGRCRDLVLLVRQKDGSSQTRNARRCLVDRAHQAVNNAATGVDRLDASAISAETDVVSTSSPYPNGNAPSTD